jgi:hypothetical protein
MDFVGQHAAHLLELQSSRRQVAVQRDISTADIVIVDRNIFENDPHTIGDTKVVIAVAGGKFAYEADAK